MRALPTHLLRRAALAGATLAAFGVAGTPAGAATKTLNYQCEWPLVGILPLKAEIDVEVPAAADTGDLPAMPVAMRLTSGSGEEDTSTWDGLRIYRAVSLESQPSDGGGPMLTISGADLIEPLRDALPLTIEKYVVPATEQDIVLDARTTIPAVAGVVAGAGNGTLTYRLADFALYLRAYKADGSLFQLPKLGDWDSEPPPYVEVSCTLDAGQDATLGTVAIGDQTGLDPSAPGKPVASELTPTSTRLEWAASTDDVGVTGYQVLRYGRVVAETTGTSTTVTGLREQTRYSLTVRAKDGDGGFSVPSEPVVVTTPPEPPVLRSYGVTGSATLTTLTKGAFPVRGSSNLTFRGAAFRGDLVLAPVKARLRALGLLPVTATVQFVTAGETSGSLYTGGRGLYARTSVRIKMPQVSLFGTIPLAGGTTCQTAEYSTMYLESTDFTPATGGKLTSTFSISDLSGCGSLNGLVSPATASADNTISLNLGPAR